MKKYFIITSLLLLNEAFSQTPDQPTTTTTGQNTVSLETTKPSIFVKKHEVRVGGLKLLAVSTLEASYEYIYSKDFTYGSSILVSAYDGISPEEFSITPFARFYFTETKEYGAKGFFVEGFAKYFTGKYEKYEPSIIWNNASPVVSVNGAALGLSLGRKWINNSGFVLELAAGYGRTIVGSTNEIPGVFRGDLSIGYRF
jgi:hypothetical protein